MDFYTGPEIENQWRFERKYRLTYEQYLQVKCALRPYLEFDPYTAAASSRQYLVRSLYFDSPDYQAYNEKLGGNHSRVKYRIRTYASTVEDGAVVRVEAKLRSGERSEKHGVFVSAQAYHEFEHCRHWDCEPNPVLIEFERSVHIHILRPKVLVQYHREGFQSRDHEGIRITFDHHVSSATARTLFPAHAFFRQHDPFQVILEIKHRDQQPGWLKAIVTAHSLRIDSNSKYCQGIEATQLDLVNHALRV